MLSEEHVERMVKDANFVNGDHVYAPQLFNDLCCHVRALAMEREDILKTVVLMRKKIALLHDATIILRNGMKAGEWGAEAAIQQRAAMNEATRLIDEVSKDDEYGIFQWNTP